MSDENYLDEFIVESFENLTSINSTLSKLEEDPDNKDIINDIYRVVHTLKGSSGLLGFKKLQDLSHVTENILDLLRQGKAQVTSDLVDVLLRSFDSAIVLLKTIEMDGNEDYISVDKITNELNTVYQELTEGQGETSTSTDDKEENVEPEEKDSTQDELKTEEDEIVEVSVATDDSESFLEEALAVPENTYIEEVVDSTSPLGSPTLVDASAMIVDEVSESTQPVSENSIVDSVIRVNVKSLDKLINLVSELVLTRNQIVQFSNHNDSPLLNRLSSELNVITSELQSDIMMTRMQPIATIFSKFDRLVRDLSKQMGKKVKLKIFGQGTELDKTLLEAIKDPITHIIRNCVDHGIELPEVREKNGKPSQGTITLQAYNKGGQVIVEITDNGKGIGQEKLLSKAIERGIVSPEKASSMSTQQINNLIFYPGISTADQITNISGRGVGMDVVKTNLEKIAGVITLNSQEGGGTSFILKIPLTLAIIPALIVRSGKEHFSIPQSSIVELVRLGENELEQHIHRIHGADFFRLRGNLIAIFNLERSLDLAEDKSTKDGLNIVVLSVEGTSYGLIVDDILDTEEIVVKPLGRKLKNLETYAGATIMSDGKVSLILDVLGFYNQMNDYKVTKEDVDSSNSGNEEEGNLFSDSQELLLFRINDERVYTVPLSLVNRLEEFQVSNVEYVGNQAIIRYREHPTPLINIENTLGVSSEGNIFKEERSLPTIMISVSGVEYGICVGEIIDIRQSDFDVDSEAVDRDGIMGTVFVDNKTVTVLDIYRLIDMQEFNKKKNKSQNKKNKVLLVDDSSMYRKVESDALVEAGYDVILAKNGEEGYSTLLKNTDVEIIVTDIEMPKLDGFGLAKKIRETDGYDKIPVVALSTRFSDEDIAKGKQCGFTRHLQKFKRDELIEVMDDLLKV